MNDVVVLLIAGIGLVVLSYFADKYIFGNYERSIVYKLVIFIILILLASFFCCKRYVSSFNSNAIFNTN